MKPYARESIIKQLSKTDVESLDVDLDSLSDQELKWLNKKFHNYPSICRYALRVGSDFNKDLVEGNLCFFSFRDTPGIQRLTFAQYLRFEKFALDNPTVYPFFRPRIHNLLNKSEGSTDDEN